MKTGIFLIIDEDNSRCGITDRLKTAIGLRKLPEYPQGAGVLERTLCGMKQIRALKKLKAEEKKAEKARAAAEKKAAKEAEKAGKTDAVKEKPALKEKPVKSKKK